MIVCSMFEWLLSTLVNRIRHWFPGFLRGPHWRVSPWWPSDSHNALQGSLLRLLSVAHSERLEVMPLIANLAAEHRGGYRRRLHRLANRLADGTPLVDALEQTPDVLRDETVLAIRFASQTGTLNSTYAFLVDSDHSASNRVVATLRQMFFSTIAVVVIFCCLLSFLMVFITPTLENILEESGTDTRASTLWPFRTLVDCSNFVANYWPLWLLAAVIIAFLYLSAWSRRCFRRVIATRWVRSAAEGRSAGLLHLLAFAVEAGRPLPAALSTLARYHFDRNVRQNLLFARNEVEQGADFWSSLAEARLLTRQEADAIANSSCRRSRAWAMRRLADWKIDELTRSVESRIALLRPLITLVLAGFVLLVCSAMFGFLTHLIQATA